VPWQSTGWTNNRNVTQLLEHMVQRGEVAIAGRRGGDRLWDLATRVYPDDPADVGEAGEPAVVEGVKGRVLRAADPVRRPARDLARRLELDLTLPR